MKPISRRELWTGAGRSAPADTPQFAPPLSGREILRQRSFPNVPLITHHGRHVRFYDDLLKDKIVVINMMYAVCEGVCPLITSNLVKAQQLLKAKVSHEIFFISITLKPEEDTPEKLRDYAAMHGVGGNWQFLTGAPADVERLRYTLGYVDINPKVDKDKTRHSGVVRFGNEPLSQWGACQGSATPSWIAEEISFVVPVRRA